MSPQFPIRILHVISSQDWRVGGVVTAVEHLVLSQKKAGLEPSIAASFIANEDFSFGNRMRELGIPVNVIGPTYNKRLKYHPRLAQYLGALTAQADVIHIHGVWEQIQYCAALAARRQKIPYVLSAHGMLDPWSLRQTSIMKKLYLSLRLNKIIEQANVLHFTSDVERDLTMANLPSIPTIVLPNGLDLSEFENLPAKGGFRSRFPEFANRKMLLCLGRIHPKKGFDILIPALAKLKRSDYFLVIAGQSFKGYEATVRQLVSEHNLNDTIRFVGPLKGMDRLAAFADADLFLLPSYQENFGIAIAEALAAGTPAIISDQVNIFKEVQNAGVAKVVRMDLDELSATIASTLSDDAWIESAASKAASFTRSRYDRDQITLSWNAEFAKLLPWIAASA